MRSAQHWVLSAFVLFFVLRSAAHGASPYDSALTTYHSTVAEVRVTFFATDEANHAVSTIDRDDFAIVDGDLVIRQFHSLARSEETAIREVILIDSSQSVAARLPATMQEVTRMVSQCLFACESVSVVSFSGSQPVLLCDGNCRTSTAIQKLLSATASGTTPLFDAIAYSASLLSHHASGVRPVLILFSDGDDTISRIPASDAFQSLTDSGVLLYAIDMDGSRGSSGSALLRAMAEASGGRYFSSVQKAPAVLPQIFEDMRSSWVVTYAPPDVTSGFHSLRILPKHNLNLRFHCRSGYYYGSHTP